MILKPEIEEVLVLEPDRICAAVLTQTITAVHPEATIHCESDPSVAAAVLADRVIDLFVVTVRSFDLDILALLGVWADRCDRRTRVLVVTPNGNSALVAAARMLPISGVFDWNHGDLQELEFALRVVAAGSCYWSRTIREREIPVSARRPQDALTPMLDVQRRPNGPGSSARRLPNRFRSPRLNSDTA